MARLKVIKISNKNTDLQNSFKKLLLHWKMGGFPSEKGAPNSCRTAWISTFSYRALVAKVVRSRNGRLIFTGFSCMFVMYQVVCLMMLDMLHRLWVSHIILFRSGYWIVSGSMRPPKHYLICVDIACIPALTFNISHGLRHSPGDTWSNEVWTFEQWYFATSRCLDLRRCKCCWFCRILWSYWDPWTAFPRVSILGL